MADRFAAELRGVTKKSGEVTTVDQIDLQIQDGNFFLLGPSGCGKITTLRMIGGFGLPTDGETTPLYERIWTEVKAANP